MGRAFEVRKHAMAKTAAAKTKLYSRYGKEIYMSAKGNPDPEINDELKRMIEKAKKDQIPNDVINRAIEKAKGGSGENYTSVRYEGFGPANSLFIVECLTDNVNRTISEVRNCFTKYNSKLRVSCSVSHMFNEQAVFAIKDVTEDEILEIVIENDIDVLEIEGDENGVSLYGHSTDYNKIRKALLKANPDFDLVTDEIMWLPMLEVEITKNEDQELFEKLMNMLEEVDDVQNVYHNVKGE